MPLLLNLANVAVFLFILVGSFLHHRRRIHVRMMSIAFALDLALLLVVEILRGAVGTFIGAASGESGGSGRALLMVHVGFSVLVLVLWIVMIGWGRKVLRGRMEYLPRHAKGARAFLLVRLGNVVTAFLV